VVLAHQVEALRRYGFERIVIAGDESNADAVHEALESAGIEPESVSYLPIAEMGRVPLGPAAAHFAGDSPLVLIEPATIPGPDLAALAEFVAAEPLKAVVVSVPRSEEIGPKSRVVSAVIGAGALTALREADPAELFSSAGIAETLPHRGVLVLDRSTRERWLKIESAEDLLRANRAYLDLMAAGDRGAFAQRGDVQGAVVVHETATLDYATVRGPAIIGPGAFVADSYIGPYTSIGHDAVIEDAEIECCVVCPSAIVRQVGARLEDSVIGPGAIVTHDPQVPRALRLSVGEDARISLP
jgi:NDP-sugar pyrophosphorylase family protein